MRGEEAAAIIKDKRAGPLSFFRDHAVELSAVLCVMYLAPNSGDVFRKIDKQLIYKAH